MENWGKQSPMSLFIPLTRFGNRLARPDILFWLLPFMMALLIVGTIAQKTIGLYAAQEKFFGSWLVMIGPVPFPGGLTLMGIFLINLLCKFIFKSDWSWAKLGTILSHFGVIVLIFGGVMTAVTSKEGFLIIPQGESNSYVEDYHERNLVVREADKVLVAVPHEQLKDGYKIAATNDLPFDLTVDKYCFNCAISRRPENLQDGWERPGKFMMLNKAEADPQDEKNMTGVEFSVFEKDGTKLKRLTFDGFPKPPVISVDGKDYKITIERAKRPIPFSVSLEEFTRTLHPGTEMASAFSSKIVVEDKERNVSFPATIEMNEPLRYRGLTLYQSSFDLSGEKPYTILTVVENKGRIFPYLASIIIALGLIIHLIIRIRNTAKRENAAK